MVSWLTCPNCKGKVGVPDRAEADVHCPQCQHKVLCVDPTTDAVSKPSWVPRWKKPCGQVLILIGVLSIPTMVRMEAASTRPAMSAEHVGALAADAMILLGMALGIRWARHGAFESVRWALYAGVLVGASMTFGDMPRVRPLADNPVRTDPPPLEGRPGSANGAGAAGDMKAGPAPIVNAAWAPRLIRTGSRPAASPAPLREATPPGRDLTTEEIVARSSASVAVIRGKSSSGTGFLVRPGLLATNAHVILNEDIRDVRAHFPSASRPSRGPFPCVLLHESPSRDLAIVAVRCDLPPLAIETREPFRPGREVTVIGNPGLPGGAVIENAVSRGVLSSRVLIDEKPYYQMSISINPGNSGGPVLNPSGRVVGVASAAVRSREAIAFCIPPDDLELAIRDAEAHSAQKDQSLGAIHEARRIAAELNKVANVYGVVLDACTKDLTQAARQGLSLGSVYRRERIGIDAALAPLESYVQGRLYERVNDVSNDDVLPAPIRAGLTDYWACCLSIRGQLYTPAGTLNEQVAKLKSLKQDSAKRRSAVKQSLDMN